MAAMVGQLLASVDWVATSAVVQALAAVVMAAVTIVYVYLTHRLLRVQEQPIRAIRLAAQEAAVRQLSTALTVESISLLGLSEYFPMAEDGTPKLLPTRKIDSVLRLLQSTLLAAAQLPPSMAVQCADLAKALLAVGNNCCALNLIIRTGFDAMRGQNPFDWEAAETMYADNAAHMIGVIEWTKRLPASSSRRPTPIRSTSKGCWSNTSAPVKALNRPARRPAPLSRDRRRLLRRT